MGTKVFDGKRTANLLFREGVGLDEDRVRALIEGAVTVTLEHFALHRPSVNVVLSDDGELQDLNRVWRGLDRPTDVLSFAEREGEALAHNSPKTFLGDIIISCQRAEAQGRELGHGVEREIVFLTVHGLLHLLGYDHVEAEDEEEMLAMQRRIMKELDDLDMKGDS